MKEGTVMPKTLAQKRADKKWIKKAYEKLLFKVRRDAVINRSAIQEHAARCGESTNAFILRAIKETIERDNSAQI